MVYEIHGESASNIYRLSLSPTAAYKDLCLNCSQKVSNTSYRCPYRTLITPPHNQAQTVSLPRISSFPKRL